MRVLDTKKTVMKQRITMARFSFQSSNSLLKDQIIYDDGLASGNTKYAEVLCASYRHCIAAHKIFQDNKGNLLFFSKENNSNGCVNTVDLTYPSAPLFLLYNTELMKGMCTSILDYCQSSRWGFDFAALK